MNSFPNQPGLLVSLVLSGLVAITGCTQSDSLGSGGKEDAADGPSQAPGAAGATGVGGGGLGGSTGSGGGGGVAGATGSGGTAGGQGGATGVVSCEQGPTTGQRCTPIPAGKVCRLGDSCVGGCAPDCSCTDGFWRCEMVCRDCNLGPNSVPPLSTPPWCEVFCDYQSPRLDAGPDAPTSDAGAGTDGVVCSGPNPARVTCVASSNQCVPSICNCSSAGTWVCTADCPVHGLPLCDGGVAPDGKASNVDAPDSRGGFDVGLCSGPNPAQVTCLTSPNQCVPSTCSCSLERGWSCTADCQSVSLPPCYGGGSPDGGPDAARPDAAPDVVAAEAPAPSSYTCRDDADCCIVIDTCLAVAHLYSKAPGATGKPSLSPPDAGAACVNCIPPAVQVRCDQGQCVGEKLSTGVDFNGPLRQDHCGPITLPDAGAMPTYLPAFLGTPPSSWGC
jgi:hypothetical protein